MPKIKVAFFFPDRKLGGGPFWLMRLASKLSEDKNYEVYYIDYIDGYSHQVNVNQSNITFINYEDYSDKVQASNLDILFAPIYHIHNMPIINFDAKVLFFNWHNLCLPCLKENVTFSNAQLHSFMKLVHKNNAEVFCDGAHYSANNEIAKIKFKPNFIPIIVDNKEATYREVVSENEINVAFLGRLVIDKIQSINNFIFNAEKLNINKIINIHIIGDGCDKDKIKFPQRKNIRLKFCGAITSPLLDKYLADNIDILFAMGTSVMEGAALGIPSVVVSADIEPYYINKFVWFYDTKNYCLGWDTYQIDKCSKKQYTLDTIINQIYEAGLKKEIGEKCYNFCKKNFSYNYSTSQLKKYLHRTTLTFSEVFDFIKNKQSKKNLKQIHWRKIVDVIRNHLFLNIIKNALTESESRILITQSNIESRILEKQSNIESRLLEKQSNIESRILEKQSNIESRILEKQSNIESRILEKQSNIESRILEKLKVSVAYQIQLQSKTEILHPRTFSKYKNIHDGGYIVLLASGPTIKKYTPIENAINIAVNGSFNFDKIDFDYYFTADYAAIKKEVIHKIPLAKNLRKAKKFYGIFTPCPASMIIPEEFAIRDEAERYYSFSSCFDANGQTMIPYIDFALDLSSDFLINHGTVAHDAFQFALYTHPAKIYLVGCDCTANGHFYTNSDKQLDCTDDDMQVLILGWKKLAEFAKIHYPSTEVISVNPVGLKGVFKDWYTE